MLRHLRATKLDLDLDIQDNGGMTALELSIRSEKLDYVKALLDNGASVLVRNANGEQALHVALGSGISNKLDMCRLLLDYKADPHTPIPVHKSGPLDTPADVFLSSLLNHLTNKETQANYELLSQLLSSSYRLGNFRSHRSLFAVHGSLDPFAELGCNVRFEPETGSAFVKFLASWEGPFPREEKVEELACDCLRRFLLKGFDPFVQQVGGLRCPDARCNDFASVSLFHAPSCAYGSIVAEYSDQKFISTLADRLLHPCRSKSRESGGSPFPRILEILLSRDIDHTLDYNHLLLTLLTRGLHDDDEIADLLKVLLVSGRADIHKRDGNGMRPVQYLLDAQESNKWRIAEILLSGDILNSQSHRHCDRNEFAGRFFLPVVEMYYTLQYRNDIRHYIVGDCRDPLATRSSDQCGACMKSRLYLTKSCCTNSSFMS